MATPTLSEAKAYIDHLDLSLIVKKLAMRSDWSLGDAEICSTLYKNYLYLIKKYDGHLPPSKEIDEFWHQHILDTQKYHEDCEHIFGRYLHHYPYYGIDEKTNQDDLNKAFDRTQECYFAEFGEYL